MKYKINNEFSFKDLRINKRTEDQPKAGPSRKSTVWWLPKKMGYKTKIKYGIFEINDADKKNAHIRKMVSFANNIIYR